MKYWLIKSEPSEFSIEDLSLRKNQTVEWFGVRNYQARNFMRNDMQIGDKAFFWHSSCKNPGIYGIVEVVSLAHPDSSQFDIDSDYYDPKSQKNDPRWWCVDVKLLSKTKYVPITALRANPKLAEMRVLQRGNRLSITPITSHEWEIINLLLLK